MSQSGRLEESVEPLDIGGKLFHGIVVKFSVIVFGADGRVGLYASEGGFAIAVL
jgi:hypothetical protein